MTMVMNPDRPVRDAGTIRIRVSIGPDDLALERLYNELRGMRTDKERRMHVRRLLYLACGAAPAAGAANIAKPTAAATASALRSDSPPARGNLTGTQQTNGPTSSNSFRLSSRPARNGKAAVVDAISKLGADLD
jgi:hypothetical protein